MASPIMSVIRVANFSQFSIRFNYILAGSRLKRLQSTSTVAENESEYSETPEYPPLFDTSAVNRSRRRRQEWYDKIQALPTVEEKLLQFCFDKKEETLRKTSKNVVTMTAFDRHYDTSRFKIFATRTSLKEGLPEIYHRMNVNALAEHIRPTVLGAIVDTFANTNQKVSPDIGDNPLDVLRILDQRRAQMMINQIFRAVIAVLSNQLPHLRNFQVDYLPRCDAHWVAGGFAPHESLRCSRRGVKMTPRIPEFTPLIEKFHVIPEDEPIDAKFQYLGKPYMHLRHTLPLPMFVDRDDQLCTAYDVPDYHYKTAASGLNHQVRFPTNVPGFWPGDPYGFGSLAVYTTEDLIKNFDRFGEDCCQDMLHGCGVLASFGWLVALAHFKGFTSYQELTYPLATQTMLTNGKHWSFYAYQLNTMCLNSDFYTKQHQNVCWTTNGMKLFDAVENGNVVGYNDDVVKLIIKFLVHAPKQREGVNLTPYLQAVEHADDDKNWADICYKFKTIFANKKHTLPYGQPLWEIIYKHKFNTRMESPPR